MFSKITVTLRMILHFFALKKCIFQSTFNVFFHIPSDLIPKNRFPGSKKGMLPHPVKIALMFRVALKTRFSLSHIV